MELDGLPLSLLTGGGLLTAIATVYYMLLTGRLATGRELSEKNNEIAFNRDTIKELTAQNGALIVERTAAVNALDALRRVVEGSI